MPRCGPMRSPSQPNSSAAGKPTNCVTSSARQQLAGVEPERRAVVHRHLDDGVHAVDVEPVREQEHDAACGTGAGARWCCRVRESRRESRRRMPSCGPRCCSRTPRITGIVNSSHHTATVTNDTCTACAESARPNSRRASDHEHVDEEQQAAAEIAERIAEARRRGRARRACATSSSSESLNTMPPLKPMVAEHEQRQRRDPLALRRRSTAQPVAATPSKRPGEHELLARARRDRRWRRGSARAAR